MRKAIIHIETECKEDGSYNNKINVSGSLDCIGTAIVALFTKNKDACKAFLQMSEMFSEGNE